MRALSSLDDDGKAVLILEGLSGQVQEGERTKKYGASGKKKFYTELYDNYKVTDHFTVGGDIYRKQGAGWPIDIITIRGKGQSEKARPDFEAPPVYNSLKEIGDQIEKIAMGDAENFGVDATRQQQDAANSNRGPRTFATGSSYGPGNSGAGSAIGQNIRPNQPGNGAGAGGQGGLNGSTEQPGVTPDGGAGSQLGSGGVRDTDNGGQPGTDDVDTSVNGGGESTGGNTGGTGTAGNADSSGVDKSSGGQGKREVIASKGQIRYKSESKSGEIGSLVPSNMAAPINPASTPKNFRIRSRH